MSAGLSIPPYINYEGQQQFGLCPHVTLLGVRKGGKRGKKRKAEEANLADEDEEAAEGGRRELVNLEDIEMIYKKKRRDKEVCSEFVMSLGIALQ